MSRYLPDHVKRSPHLRRSVDQELRLHREGFAMSTAHSGVDSSTKEGDHVDAKGIPIAPKSMIDLESWKDGDAEIWDKVISHRTA